MNKKNGVNKITRGELDELQGFAREAQNVKLDIADLEVRKIGAYEYLKAVNKKYQETTKKLQEKYGEVNISIKDGSISPIEKKEAPLTVEKSESK